MAEPPFTIPQDRRHNRYAVKPMALPGKTA
jgi:hypothetical protein